MAVDSEARRLLARVRRAARAAAGRRPPAPRPPTRPARWDSTQTSALYAWCVATGVDTRPQYLWPLLHAAHAAAALGIPEIAALGFTTSHETDGT